MSYLSLGIRQGSPAPPLLPYLPESGSLVSSGFCPNSGPGDSLELGSGLQAVFVIYRNNLCDALKQHFQ